MKAFYLMVNLSIILTFRVSYFTSFSLRISGTYKSEISILFSYDSSCKNDNFPLSAETPKASKNCQFFSLNGNHFSNVCRSSSKSKGKKEFAKFCENENSNSLDFITGENYFESTQFITMLIFESVKAKCTNPKVSFENVFKDWRRP